MPSWCEGMYLYFILHTSKLSSVEIQQLWNKGSPSQGHYLVANVKKNFWKISMQETLLPLAAEYLFSLSLVVDNTKTANKLIKTQYKYQIQT